MSSPKTPKTPQRRRLSVKEKVKIIEDSKKPGFDKARIMKECGISRPTVSCTAYLVTPLDLVTLF